MDETTKQTIKERFKSLPNDIRELILSDKFEGSLAEINAQFQLNTEQIVILERETTIVLLGMTPIKDFEAELTHELKIDEIKGGLIIKEIDSKIFFSVQDSLNLINTPEEEPQTEAAEQTEEKLDSRFAVLPKEVQDAIRKINYHKTLYEIAGEYKLVLSQIEDLEKITTNVMLGAVKGNDFEGTVKKSLNLPDDKKKDLVKVITERILNKVIGEMKKTYSTPEKIITPDYTEEEIKKNAQIFSEHGIEIISDQPKPITEQLMQPEKLEISTSNPAVMNVEKPITPAQNNIVLRPSIIMQKLSAALQTPIVKTEHSLNNLTPGNTQSGKPKTDPYREIPE